MKRKFPGLKNYQKSKEKLKYTELNDTSTEVYNDLGFKCGLEVHQQLLTKEKLFCRCPAGVYQKFNDFDAEVVRHMRPTLSELGEYDGTALMEFKTRKNITYRLKNYTACTYEIDDTPPFPMNREALEQAVVISLLLKLNVVGEIHITRKQYLDGSIPTGFQRTAIIGIEGEVPVGSRKVRLIQLSIEEDSCREVSDIGHERIYVTDRLGMPLIEAVTYPEMKNPWESRDCAQAIRFILRSTGLVRKGIGAAREDVNVSIAGGTRVEIKGVAHVKWIPALTHNEAFRQKALLEIKKILQQKFPDQQKWALKTKTLNQAKILFEDYQPYLKALEDEKQIVGVCLPGFKNVLSFFTQPGRAFSAEISDRLKVIACLEKPNMIISESLEYHLPVRQKKEIDEMLECDPEKDSWLVFWAAENDVQTALETIEERCKLAFIGVPEETRKSFPDGTTMFERVLPGSDRMYPDTDSAPISLKQDYIDSLIYKLPVEITKRYAQLQEWEVPIDCYTYLFRNDLFSLIEKIANDFKHNPRYLAIFFAHRIKSVEGRLDRARKPVDFNRVYEMFGYLYKHKLHVDLAKDIIKPVLENPFMYFSSILESIDYKENGEKDAYEEISQLNKMFSTVECSKNPKAKRKWIMGTLHKTYCGNVSLSELGQIVDKQIQG